MWCGMVWVVGLLEDPVHLLAPLPRLSEANPAWRNKIFIFSCTITTLEGEGETKSIVTKYFSFQNIGCLSFSVPSHMSGLSKPSSRKGPSLYS